MEEVRCAGRVRIRREVGGKSRCTHNCFVFMATVISSIFFQLIGQTECVYSASQVEDVWKHNPNVLAVK